MNVASGRGQIEVARTGLVCSLGRSPAQAALLLRAGHSELRLTPFGRPGRVLRMCHLRELPTDLVGFDRLLCLAAAALRQALPEPPEAGEAAEPIPLLLALPPVGRPDDDEVAAARFAENLRGHTGLSLDVERSRTIRAGHASGARLLAHGQQLLSDGDVPAVLVGGADGYFHPELLRQLDDDERILGRGNTDGFLPGEAAAFVLLRRPAREADGPPLAHLCGVGAAEIPKDTTEAVDAWWRQGQAPKTREASESRGTHHPRSAAANRTLAAARRARGRARLAFQRLARNTLGGGSAWWRRPNPSRRRFGRQPDPEDDAPPDVTVTMTELCESVMAGKPVDWVLTDFNHGALRTDEWDQVARQLLSPEVVHSRLLGQLGDLGAATIPALLGLACAQWHIGSAPAPAALLAAHSDDGERGAVLLRESP
ncbi:MAG: hypothetical protein JRI68_29015 [Deltaproteobacteria bacterium]|nr:hypothetical protein [Deltaproteobacteria bacterium]